MAGWRGGLLFLGAGGTGYLVDTGTLAALHGGLGVALPAATTAAYGAGLSVNYALNRTLAFRSRSRAGSELTRYLLLCAANYATTVALVPLLAAQGLNYLLAKTLVTACAFLANYALCRHWVFQPPADPPALAPQR